MITTTAPDFEQRFVLDEVDWDFYEAVLQRVGDRHIFVTYDKGRVELMSPSLRHDLRARLIGLVINVLAEELLIPIQGCGSTTFRRKDVEAGLEPDQCFYVQQVDAVLGKDEIDLSIDPPPDLAIEVEVSRRIIKRIPLYQSLGIPELWRDDGKRVRIFLLDQEKKYQEVDRSVAFPTMPIEQISCLLDLAGEMNEMTWTRAVRKWVREHLVPKS